MGAPCPAPHPRVHSCHFHLLFFCFWGLSDVDVDASHYIDFLLCASSCLIPPWRRVPQQSYHLQAHAGAARLCGGASVFLEGGERRKCASVTLKGSTLSHPRPSLPSAGTLEVHLLCWAVENDSAGLFISRPTPAGPVWTWFCLVLLSSQMSILEWMLAQKCY